MHTIIDTMSLVKANLFNIQTGYSLLISATSVCKIFVHFHASGMLLVQIVGVSRFDHIRLPDNQTHVCPTSSAVYTRID